MAEHVARRRACSAKRGPGVKCENLTAKRFGRLRVLRKGPNAKSGSARWYCVCDCKNVVLVKGSHLKDGSTKSCGCHRRDRLTTHNMTGTKLYVVWHHMLSRCYNKNTKDYPRYGGRGIQVCDRWEKSFEAFVVDMGGNYKEGLTLDRIGNEVNYEPTNCRWSTYIEQNNNRRSNHHIEIDGTSKTIAQWAREFGISDRTIKSRINYGWDPVAAVTTPPRAHKIYKKKETV